jgi:hypothetical protein
MGLDDGRRANVAIIGPKAGAGCCAGGAQDTLGGIVEALAVFRRLQALAAVGRNRLRR